jgi:hypothetical protein
MLSFLHGRRKPLCLLPQCKTTKFYHLARSREGSNSDAVSEVANLNPGGANAESRLPSPIRRRDELLCGPFSLHGNKQVEIWVLTTAPQIAAILRKNHVAKALFRQNCPSKSADFCKMYIVST